MQILSFQLSLDKQIVKPYTGICCESCWKANKKKCTCRCGGEHHGAGNPDHPNYQKMNEKRIRVAQSVNWNYRTYRTYPSAQTYKKLITDPHCHCGFDLSKEPVLAYAHSDGWEVAESDELQWLCIICPNCGYDMSIWKIGVPREATLKDVQ